MPAWKPGQSGNPKGGSKKARARKLLREAVREALEKDVPEELRETLRGVLGADLIGETVCEVIAARLAAMALGGPNNVALSAIREIVGLEPKAVTHEFPDGAPERAERFKTPDEHRARLRELLEERPDGVTVQ